MEILKCQLLTCENQNMCTCYSQKSVFLGRFLNMFENMLIFIPSLSKINGRVIEEPAQIELFLMMSQELEIRVLGFRSSALEKWGF